LAGQQQHHRQLDEQAAALAKHQEELNQAAQARAAAQEAMTNKVCVKESVCACFSTIFSISIFFIQI